jgi:pyruvate,water dikinase
VREAANPVHAHSAPATRWTTVNVAEAIQGVQTPLSYGLWAPAMEHAIQGAFVWFGAIRRVTEPLTVDDGFSAPFFGRAAGNMSYIAGFADLLPGTNGDVVEEKVFGKPPGPPRRKPLSVYRGYPRILTHLPRACWRAPRELPGLLDDNRRWWRRAVLDAPPSDLASAQRLFTECHGRFVTPGVLHTVVSFLGPELLAALSSMAHDATGAAGLGYDLATGFGGMEETGIVADLWAAAHGQRTIAAIQRRHGFHGPNEGQLESRSWREDPTPIEVAIRAYATGAGGDPRVRERVQAERREAAFARVAAGLPRWRRPQLRLVSRIAGSFIPAREIGKAAFLHAIDGGRCAARAGGRELASRGAIDEPEDVFFLTPEEFLGEPRDFRERVAERRADHVRYERLTLPEAWTGDPEPIPLTTDRSSHAPTRFDGIGIIGGRVTGRARIIDDPATAELEPGDILVCQTTDPSWVPLFMLVDAVVVDIGGQMSHGAIVARELGVTCVVNTRSGTRDIPDGAMIAVDGSAGVVEVI